MSDVNVANQRSDREAVEAMLRQRGYLSVKEAVKHFPDVRPGNFHNWYRKHQIVAQRVGATLWVNVESVRAWLSGFDQRKAAADRLRRGEKGAGLQTLLAQPPAPNGHANGHGNAPDAPLLVTRAELRRIVAEAVKEAEIPREEIERWVAETVEKTVRRILG